jgi:hypothetical protein
MMDDVHGDAEMMMIVMIVMRLTAVMLPLAPAPTKADTPPPTLSLPSDDSGKALPEPVIRNLGDIAELVAQVSPVQRDRYVRMLLEKARTRRSTGGGRDG